MRYIHIQNPNIYIYSYLNATAIVYFIVQCIDRYHVKELGNPTLSAKIHDQLVKMMTSAPATETLHLRMNAQVSRAGHHENKAEETSANQNRRVRATSFNRICARRPPST